MIGALSLKAIQSSALRPLAALLPAGGDTSKLIAPLAAELLAASPKMGSGKADLMAQQYLGKGQIPEALLPAVAAQIQAQQVQAAFAAAANAEPAPQEAPAAPAGNFTLPLIALAAVAAGLLFSRR